MEEILNALLKIVFCHLVGDYVLQSDYIAKGKVHDFYLLLVHCVLYCLPFYLVYGFNIQLVVLFIMHIIIDLLKCIGKIDIVKDQVLHYVLAILLYIGV